MIALQDLITETLNIFESEDIKQLERERMRLYMKVKNWKKSGKDVSELEKQLNDAKKRLSDAKKAVRLVAKGAVVTPQQITPTGDDSLSGDLGTDGFGSLDIDALMGSISDDVVIKHEIKQYILDNYNISETDFDNCIEIIKQRNGDFLVNHLKQWALSFKQGVESLTGGLFKWGKVNIFDCQNTDILTLEGAPQECEYFFCNNCKKLKTLEGAPQKCDTLRCDNCALLKSLKGAPQECRRFECTNCPWLMELVGAPQKCEAFECGGCGELIRLNGAPQECKIFGCIACGRLKDLTGGPIKCDKYNCSECTSLISLKGAPKKCNKFSCANCRSLKSLEYAPACKELDCQDTGIKDLTGVASNTKLINVSLCRVLTSLKGCPKGLQKLFAISCGNLNNINDLPESVSVIAPNTPIFSKK